MDVCQGKLADLRVLGLLCVHPRHSGHRIARSLRTQVHENERGELVRGVLFMPEDRNAQLIEKRVPDFVQGTLPPADPGRRSPGVTPAGVAVLGLAAPPPRTRSKP